MIEEILQENVGKIVEIRHDDMEYIGLIAKIDGDDLYLTDQYIENDQDALQNTEITTGFRIPMIQEVNPYGRLDHEMEFSPEKMPINARVIYEHNGISRVGYVHYNNFLRIQFTSIFPGDYKPDLHSNLLSPSLKHNEVELERIYELDDLKVEHEDHGYHH